MSEDAISRAKAIAARLSSRIQPPVTQTAAPVDNNQESVLGKRGRDDSSGAEASTHGQKRKKIYVPSDKYPTVNFLGLIIGPRGATQKALEAETGARILMRGRGASLGSGEQDDGDDLHVLITADNDEMMEHAVARVNELLFNPEKHESVKAQQLSVLHDGTVGVGAVGAGGGHEGFKLPLNLYANDDGFHMSRSHHNNNNNNNTAPADESSGPFRSMAMTPKSLAPGDVVQEIHVPNEKVGLVIGKQGDTIKQLQAFTGAQIQIAKEPVNNGTERTITLQGSPAQVQLAEIEIRRVTAGGRMSMEPQMRHHSGLGYTDRPPAGAGGPTEEETIQVPQPYVGLVIGKSGETVRQIQMRTGATIFIVKENVGPDRDIRLSGTREAIDAARNEIHALIATTQNAGAAGPPQPGMDSRGQITIQLPVPNHATGSIIGRGGEVIKRLQHSLNVKISISKDDGGATREVSILGLPHQVEIAKAEVERLVRDKEAGIQSMPGAIGGRGPPRAPYGAPAYGYAPYGAPAYSPYGAPAPYGAPYGAPAGYPGAPAYDPYGYAAAAVPQAAPIAPPVSSVPVPPADPSQFEAWWGTLSLEQQKEYYRANYPEMLSQLEQATSGAASDQPAQEQAQATQGDAQQSTQEQPAETTQ